MRMRVRVCVCVRVLSNSAALKIRNSIISNTHTHTHSARKQGQRTRGREWLKLLPFCTHFSHLLRLFKAFTSSCVCVCVCDWSGCALVVSQSTASTTLLSVRHFAGPPKCTSVRSSSNNNNNNSGATQFSVLFLYFSFALFPFLLFFLRHAA